MTATDRHIVRTVLRHNGINGAELAARLERNKPRREIRSYRMIYASLTHEEKVIAHAIPDSVSQILL